MSLDLCTPPSGVSGTDAPVMLVTGGSRGIGAATVLLAARQGWRVAFCWRSNAVAAQELVQQLAGWGHDTLAEQADVVIAVNVGSPLMKAEEVGSLFTVSAQMINILTEQNVNRSLALLQPTDIYIKPDLDGITAGDVLIGLPSTGNERSAPAGTSICMAAMPVKCMLRIPAPSTRLAAYLSSW